VRVANRVVSALVALALLAAAAIGLVEIVLAALGRAPWLVERSHVAADLHERAWEDGGVRLIAILVMIVGLVLVVVALKRSLISDLRMTSDSDAVEATVTRKSLQSYLAGVAASQGGVTSASASIGRKRVVLTVESPLRDPGDLGARVDAVVTERLSSLRLANPMQSSVKIQPGAM
jgi:hypothetical protein